MKAHLSRFILSAACVVLVVPPCVAAQTMPPASITTPDRVESRIGTLEFKDGVPGTSTADKVYDNIDFVYAYRAFMDNLRGVSIHALRKGMQDIGVKANEVLVFSELMDARSLFLTANADTVYVMGYLDLTKGPVVIETPPKFLGVVQDAWFRWVIDLGLPGPDRGEGGKYLIVPPAYDGPLPDGGFFVARAQTNTILWFARSFLENHNDPKPVVETIRHDSPAHFAGALATSIDARIARTSASNAFVPPGHCSISPVSHSACRFVPCPNACNWNEFPPRSSAKPACSGWWTSATKCTTYLSALSRTSSSASAASTAACRSMAATTHAPSGQSRRASYLQLLSRGRLT